MRCKEDLITLEPLSDACLGTYDIENYSVELEAPSALAISELDGSA